jgi:hypothetical protein
MALSVLSATGVVTTQTVAAQPNGPLVTYSPGSTYSYRPSQFNNDFTYFVGAGTLSAIASYGGASASASTTNTQNGWALANVGMWWTLNLPTSGPCSTWASVQGQPCTVTVTVTYHISSKGNASAEAFWGPLLSGDQYNKVASVNGTVPAKGATTTYTWHGTVGELFWSESRTGRTGTANGEVQTSAFNGGKASATISVSGIVLRF